MADDKTQTGKADRSRVNLNEDYELQYWTGKFGVNRAQLEEAVNAVGDNALEVEVYLNKKAREAKTQS
jgi:hypothetical protein